MRSRIWRVHAVAIAISAMGALSPAHALIACAVVSVPTPPLPRSLPEDARCTFTVSTDTTVHYAGSGNWKISVILPTLSRLGVMNGGIERAGFGSALAVADLDRDGRDDIIVGEPGAPGGSDGGNGRVYIFGGQDPTPRMTINPPPGTTGFGTSLATGDIDGDGFADLAVGGHGSVSAFEGESGRHLTTFLGVEPGDDLGAHVAVGDMDRDGFADIVASSPSALNGAGRILTFELPTGDITSIDGAPGERLGSSLALADLDRDGKLDIVAGARDDLGGGGVTIILAADARSFVRVRDIDQSPDDGLAIGDLNADGYPDIVVGSPGAANGDGQVTAIDGRKHTFIWISAADLPSARAFGRSVAIGDMNGDGIAEVIVGAPGTNQVVVMTGRRGRVTATDSCGNGRCGTALAVGDLDGDGLAELAIGAPLTDVEGSDGTTPPLDQAGAVETRTPLKTAFEDGDVPTSGQFWALIDSVVTLSAEPTVGGTPLPPGPSSVWASTSNVG